MGWYPSFWWQWLLEKSLPLFLPLPVVLPSCSNGLGPGVRVGEDVLKSALLTHSLNYGCTKQVVLCARWCQKEEWESALVVWTSLLMLFFWAKISGRMQPLGSPGDGHRRGCISGEPVGEPTAQHPATRNSWGSFELKRMQGRKRLAKGNDLVLVLFLP